jgi:hypothetical protein
VYPPITTLPGSDLHRTAIALYQRHQVVDDHARCGACSQSSPCTARRDAAAVIAAAGEDPHWYDGRLPEGNAQLRDPAPLVSEDHASQPNACFAQSWRPAQLPTKPKPSIDTPGVTGWSVGGIGRADVPFVEYER